MKKIIHHLKKSQTQNQMIMFPFAGGHGRSYLDFVKDIKQDIDIIGINPVGHLFCNEQPLESIDSMVSLYAAELEPILKDNVVVYGHSMGGCITYEFCKKVKSKKIKSVILTGSHPPHSILDDDEEDSIHSSMNDEEILNKCIKYGGFKEELRNESEFCEIFCRIMKADLRALENYIVQHKVEFVDIPAYLFFGTEEKLDFEEAQEWNRYFQLKNITECPGNHFFIFDKDNKEMICRIIDQCFTKTGNDS